MSFINLSSLLENSIDAVYLLDERGKVLQVNRMACVMLGYNQDELLQLTIDDIDKNCLSQRFVAFWSDKTGGSSFLFESTHIHKNGTRIPVEVNGIFLCPGERSFFLAWPGTLPSEKKQIMKSENSWQKKKPSFEKFTIG